MLQKERTLKINEKLQQRNRKREEKTNIAVQLKYSITLKIFTQQAQQQNGDGRIKSQ